MKRKSTKQTDLIDTIGKIEALAAAASFLVDDDAEASVRTEIISLIEDVARRAQESAEVGCVA